MFKKIATLIGVLFVVISLVVVFILTRDGTSFDDVENITQENEVIQEELSTVTENNADTENIEIIDEPITEETTNSEPETSENNDEVIEEEPIEEIVEDEAEEEEVELSELEGESYFKGVPMPVFDQTTFNGVDVSPMDYIHPHTDVVEQLSANTINWGDTHLLRGEYVFFIQDILNIGTEVSFEEDVEGKNVIKIRVDESQNSNFTPDILEKLEQGFERSEMYSPNVEYEFSFIQ